MSLQPDTVDMYFLTYRHRHDGYRLFCLRDMFDAGHSWMTMQLLPMMGEIKPGETVSVHLLVQDKAKPLRYACTQIVEKRGDKFSHVEEKILEAGDVGEASAVAASLYRSKSYDILSRHMPGGK